MLVVELVAPPLDALLWLALAVAQVGVLAGLVLTVVVVRTVLLAPAGLEQPIELSF